MRWRWAALFAMPLLACGGGPATTGDAGGDVAVQERADGDADADADGGSAGNVTALGLHDCALDTNPFCLLDPPFRGVWQSGPDDVWILASDFQEVSARHWDGRAWTPHDLGSGALAAIAGSGPGDVWAVGPAGRIVHGDGARFVAVDGGGGASLAAVWAGGARDAWAVGWTPGPPARAVTLRWDGAAWATVDGSAADGDGDTALRAVWGSGPGDVWAVGDRTSPADGTPAPVAIHWDGARWSAVAIARPDLGLASVWGSGPDDVWFGGNGQILHFDGTAIAPVRDGIVGTVAALGGSGPSDAWAVGTRGLALHWDGAAWRAAPSGTTNDLGALSGGSAGDAWAVGPAGSALHWDGAAWTVIADGSAGALEALWGTAPDNLWTAGPLRWDGARFTPDDSDAFIPALDICGFAPDDLWAVGVQLQNGLDVGYVAHRDGSDWTIHGIDGVYLPYSGRDPNLGPSSLRALWCHTPSDIWAVGQMEDVVGNVITTAAHWDGARWSPVATPSTWYLNGVWGSAADDVWAAGGTGTLLHWDGAAWTAFDSGTAAHLGAVWGSAAGDVWVVVQGTPDLLHWDGAAWRRVPTGAPAPGPSLTRLWGTGARDLWAVGGDTTGGAVLHWDGTAWTTAWMAPAAVGRLDGIWGDGATLFVVAQNGMLFARR